MNVPTKMNAYFHQCSVFAQQRSNKIALQMIHYLAGQKNQGIPFSGGFRDPWQPDTFAKAAVSPAFVQAWTKKFGVKRG
ncbi:hypothetical protein [Acidithiobacillus ferrivorans]|nr:hypothetical protein [Acidithiobacillus ferrivorans]